MLDETLPAEKRDPGEDGIGYVEKNGRVVLKCPTVFVKATNNVDQGECSEKPALIHVEKKVISNPRVFCNSNQVYGHIRP